MLPEQFIAETRRLMGERAWEMVEHAILDDLPPVSVRLHPKKSEGFGMASPLATRVPWCPSGMFLPTREAFTFDPLFHAGAYYVQESASMFIDLVLRQYVRQPVIMLDLCAAPGGKSTAARAALPDGSLLVCNEPVASRAQVLAENMQKWGHRDVIVTNNLPKDFRKTGMLFDVVLADVPCSGEGMFRKDPGAREEWSMQNVERCQALQREIVQHIWPCLQPGGIMIYSTCTFNQHENEDNVEWICREMGAEVLDVDTDDSWGIRGSLSQTFHKPVYRFIPGFTKSEGLFMAILRKDGENETSRKGKKENGRKAKGKPQTPKGWEMMEEQGFEWRDNGAGLFAIPGQWASCHDRLDNSLRLLHAGIRMGEVKGKELLPHPSLALATGLGTLPLPKYGLSYDEAITFLRKESLTLTGDRPRGWTTVAYNGLNLGFVKNIGNRANNPYPQGWKIKSSHAPDNPPKVLRLNNITSS